MNRITQEAKKRQGAVLWGIRHGKRDAARKYGVSLSSIKRWSKRYDGTWQSLREKSHRPHHSPRRHSTAEEDLLREVFVEKYLRYGWDGVYTEAQKRGYQRSLLFLHPLFPLLCQVDLPVTLTSTLPLWLWNLVLHFSAQITTDPILAMIS